ncbi:protein-L-isoaspartate O-methyltransferase [Candidatus Wolfebacteria bacterium]|nr:protein-L-isoaspartate O-methyltransferase [Candidatus Wolfebacteria bacterium]
MTEEYRKLVQTLIKDGYLKTSAIIEAFTAVDRADFVPDEHKDGAYTNAPLPIGHGQTISQPLTVAFMLELLEPNPGEKILDVGAGSGWTATLLAFILSKTKQFNRGTSDVQNIDTPNAGTSDVQKLLVVGIERIPELKNFAEKNISKYGCIEKGIVKLIRGDGSRGYKREAPYDKILAGAASDGDIPPAWRNQVKIGGRIVAPVGASVRVIDKLGKNNYNVKDYFGFSFVPLVRG